MNKTEHPPDEQKLTLTIEKLVHGGAGLARINGKTCFIDGVLPGETVLARIDENRKQYLKASLLDILEASPERTAPPCPFAGLCGGCQWQHISYPGQLAYKASALKDCLVRIGKLYDCEISPPAPSPLQLRYRSRAALKIDNRKSPAMGFYQTKTHTLVRITDCLLLEPELIQALEVCRQLLRHNRLEAGGYTGLDLLAVTNTTAVLSLWQDRKNRKKKKLLLNTATGTAGEQQSPLTEPVEGLIFLRDTEIFYQVNRQQNLAMIHTVLEFMEPVAGSGILDLFCGCGNFSLFLAKQCAKITGIDSNKAAIIEARNNTRLNGIENAQFQTANIADLNENGLAKNYAGVLINPPRGGCEARTLHLLAEKNPAVIVYVSCDPSTLARDVRVLVDRGYTIDAIQPFDMFPQTYHIETIVKLTK
ncbi:MAG: class I SAM-dependent RNA methyltransferase [Deltaproteobacteria bacterium]|nr:class I SAM-dependent RNA methyltransferase [Deltaproteobacteria bacterium]